MLILLLLLIQLSAAEPIYESKIRLENFKQLPNSTYLIDVTNGTYTVAYINFGKQVDDIYPTIHYMENSSIFDIGKTNESGIICVPLNESVYNDATLIVFLNDGREVVGYIGLLRQSELQLKSRFNFTKRGGYTVVGRTSRWLLPNESFKVGIFKLPTVPDVDFSDYYTGVCLPDELKETVAIMRYIWKEPIETGPSTIQCQGVRDLAAAYAIKSTKIPSVKLVNLRQYYPQFPDLIGNSHAVMEVYSPYYRKYVLVDPYFGKMFWLHGVPLNADEIKEMSPDEREEIKPIKYAENSTALDYVFSEYHLNYDYYTYFNTDAEVIVKDISKWKQDYIFESYKKFFVHSNDFFTLNFPVKQRL